MSQNYVGFGALAEGMAALVKRKPERVLAVASPGSWNRFPVKDFPVLTDAKLFQSFSNNPDYAEILAGVESARQLSPDCIIAIGGGSAIDVAKVIRAIGMTGKRPDRPADIVPCESGTFLAAIATTSGSGSEATPFAVFYHNGSKASLGHPSLLPDLAVIDPELTYSLPPYQTAATGFDALCQAIEAYWAASATEEARTLATAAIRYAWSNVVDAATAPSPSSRYAMAMAGHLAGKAISFTRTTLPHALGYHLTTHYGLAHGHAVALVMPYVFYLNAMAVQDYPDIEPVMGEIATFLGQKAIGDCVEPWRTYMRLAGLTATLPEAGIQSSEQIDQLIASADPERLANHPVPVDPARLREIMETL